MSAQPEDAQTALPEILLYTLRELVNREGRDLTARQLGLFLVCYLSEEPQTVRGLAAHLGISRAVVSRALDRLANLSLAARGADHRDRRSILVRRTPEGWAFLRGIGQIVRQAARKVEEPTRPDRSRRRRVG